MDCLRQLKSIGYIVGTGVMMAAEGAVMPVADVLAKGGDYRADDVVGADTVRNAGGRVEIIPFVEGRSSSALISKLNAL